MVICIVWSVDHALLQYRYMGLLALYYMYLCEIMAVMLSILLLSNGHNKM